MRLSPQRILLATLLAAGAAGAAADEERIEIRADSAELDQAASRSVYRGNVVLTRNGLELRGDELVVVRGDGNRVTAVLTGKPARLRQTPTGDDNAPVTGAAGRMTYETGRERIELQGNAIVERGGNALEGETIIHHLTSGRTTAHRAGEEDGERVRILLNPPPEGGTETGGNGDER